MAVPARIFKIFYIFRMRAGTRCGMRK